MDFFEDALAYINNKGGDTPRTEPEPVKEDLFILEEEPEPEAPEVLTPTVEKHSKEDLFTIDDTNNTITIEGVTYPIPSYYNKEMIRQREKNTIEMIFISAGRTDLIER